MATIGTVAINGASTLSAVIQTKSSYVSKKILYKGNGLQERLDLIVIVIPILGVEHFFRCLLVIYLVQLLKFRVTSFYTRQELIEAFTFNELSIF